MVFRKLYLLASILFFPPGALLSQITVNNSQTPQQLVQNILLGQGVQVSNITFSGDPLQIGSFSGNSSMGLSSGLILASGDVQVAAGPNNQGGATMTITPSGTGSDPDLTAIANAGTNDASVLEFDFVPVGDTLRFRYVFASEEYLEFVNGGYNDAFGFFVSGPGITGPYTNNAQNIALIPGTSTPVTIDNVNNVSNSAYYINNGDGSNAPYNSSAYYLQFDGFTTVLDALITVQCGETYHIKLAIADAGDSALDSGVFLEGGSFMSNGIVVSVVTATGDSTVVEGCADAVFTFTRNDTLGDATIHYLIGGNAINGTDYSLIPDSVSILQGQTTTSLTIFPLADTLVEGTDTLTITIFNISECGDTLIEQASLYILEDYTLAVTADDAVINCPGDTIALTAFASGGVPPYHFVWSNGDSTGTAFVSPMGTDTFFVTVTDSCFFSPTIDTVIVTLQPIPVLLAVSNDTVLFCPNDTVVLSASASSGTGTGYQYWWSNGDVTSSTSVFPASDTVFYVTATDACGIDSVSDSISISFSIPQLNLSVSNDTSTLCMGAPLDLLATGSSGTPPYSYLWSNGDSSGLISVNPTGDTTFYVTLTDACGAAPVSDSIHVTFIIPQLILTVSNDTVSTCAGAPVTLSAAGSSGTSPYTYTWSNGNSGNSIPVFPVSDSTFYVTLTDACGAPPVYDSIIVTMAISPLSLTVSNDVTIACPGDIAVLNAVVTSGATPYSYLWSTGESTTSISVNPTVNTTYYITVSNTCGASPVYDSILVSIQSYPPIALSVSDDTSVTCSGDAATLTSAVSGGASPYTYQWSSGSNNSSATVTPGSTTEYFITVTDKCGTDTVDSVTVTVPVYQPLLPLASDHGISCPDDSAFVTVAVSGGTGSGYTFLWNNGSTNDSIYVSPGITTDFFVTVTDACGNTASDTATLYVPVFAPVAVLASDYDTICNGDTVILNATATGGNGVYTFAWSGNGTILTNPPAPPQSIPLSTGLYNVTATDQCGSNNNDETLITVEDCNLVFPNIFTPDGDNANQYFFIRNLEKHQQSELVVFNRWGRKVYESGDYQNNWNGDGVHDGVYFYVLTLTGGETFNGTVTIVR